MIYRRHRKKVELRWNRKRALIKESVHCWQKDIRSVSEPIKLCSSVFTMEKFLWKWFTTTQNRIKVLFVSQNPGEPKQVYSLPRTHFFKKLWMYISLWSKYNPSCKAHINEAARNRHLFRKTAVLSCHRCLINSGISTIAYIFQSMLFHWWSLCAKTSAIACDSHRCAFNVCREIG